MDVSLSKFQEIAEDKKDWDAAVHGVTKSLSDWMAEQLSDWATIAWFFSPAMLGLCCFSLTSEGQVEWLETE